MIKKARIPTEPPAYSREQREWNGRGPAEHISQVNEFYFQISRQTAL